MRHGGLALALALVACGSSGPAPTPHRLVGEPGGEDDEGEPLAIGARSLPPLPVGVHESDEVVGTALDRVRDATLPARPALDDGASEAETARFMREEFQAWLVTRARAIGVARDALSAMEQGESDEYVLASALLGTLFAMLASEIVEMPLPRVVRDDGTQRVLVREALLEAAAPLYRRALEALGACASAAAGAADPSLDSWSRYCDEASSEAQEAPRPVDEGPTRDADTDAGVATP